MRSLRCAAGGVGHCPAVARLERNAGVSGEDLPVCNASMHAVPSQELVRNLGMPAEFGEELLIRNLRLGIWDSDLNLRQQRSSTVTACLETVPVYVVLCWLTKVLRCAAGGLGNHPAVACEEQNAFHCRDGRSHAGE